MGKYANTPREGGKLEETKRIVRVLSLISLIGNGPRRWTRKHLAAHLEVSERQIDKDLTAIRHGLGYELGHAKEGYYFSRAPELRAIQYTPAEALALLGALSLALGSGSLDAGSLGAALARTEEALPGPYLDLARALRLRARTATARQQHRAAIYEIIQTALAERRCVEVTYESARRGGTLVKRILRPYDLTTYDGAWLLTAHDSDHDEVRYFKLDRMTRASLTEARYTVPSDFDAASYRGLGWGILRDTGSELVDVRLRFTPEEGRRVRDDTYHESQRETRQSDGSWLVNFRVGITSELVRWVFRWGTGCEVVAPPELRARVAEQARKIAELNGA